MPSLLGCGQTLVRMGHTTLAQTHSYGVFRPIPRCREVPREQVHGHQVTVRHWKLDRSPMALGFKGLKGTKERAEQRQGVFRGMGRLSQQAFRGF